MNRGNVEAVRAAQSHWTGLASHSQTRSTEQEAACIPVSSRYRECMRHSNRIELHSITSTSGEEHTSQSSQKQVTAQRNEQSSSAYRPAVRILPSLHIALKRKGVQAQKGASLSLSQWRRETKWEAAWSENEKRGRRKCSRVRQRQSQQPPQVSRPEPITDGHSQRTRRASSWQHQPTPSRMFHHYSLSILLWQRSRQKADRSHQYRLRDLSFISDSTGCRMSHQPTLLCHHTPEFSTQHIIRRDQHFPEAMLRHEAETEPVRSQPLQHESRTTETEWNRMRLTEVRFIYTKMVECNGITRHWDLSLEGSQWTEAAQCRRRKAE